MILFIALTLIMAGIIFYVIWYVEADPKIKLGKYKDVTVEVDLSINEDNLLNAADEREEKIKQALLNKLVKNSSYSHLGKVIDKRTEDFMNYYDQITKLYDYQSLEEMAQKYYGYASLGEFQKAVEKYSELAVKQEMLLAEIAKKEGFSVTDEIFNKYIVNYLKAYDYKEDEVDAYLENYGKEEVYEVILADYTLDYLLTVNTIKVND